MPTRFQGVISVDWHREFTRMERLKIALGFNLAVAVRIVTQHSPGKYNPVIVAETTRSLTASDSVRDRLKDVLAEQNAANIVQ